MAVMQVDANLERSVMWKYSPILSLIFLADGDRMELKIEKYDDQTQRLEWNRGGKEYFYRFTETGICNLSKIQYEKIMSAKNWK